MNPTTASLSIAVICLGACLPAAVPQDQDPHGAAASTRQQARLDALLPDRDWTLPPRGIDPVVWKSFVPEDNATTRDRVALGRKLYFDKRLSRDDSVSCATCHDVTRGFTDQRMVSEGIGGKLGRRNAPTTLNAALIEPLFLDGRSATLEQQAGQPILNPIEMGMPDRETATRKIAGIEEYPPLFQKAYGRSVNYADIERAIAAFERTLIFLDAPFDRFLAGDEKAISAAAKAGWDLFNGAARCATCHPIHGSSPIGSDGRFHNVGVSARKQDFDQLARRALELLGKNDTEEELDRLALSTDMSELGRFMVTRQRPDIGSFRTLQLRNVGITGPYMHDGSLGTLWDVMDHYNKGGEDNSFLDGGMEALALTEEQIDQVVAFLFSLTDVRFAEENAALQKSQAQRARTQRPFRDTELAMRKKIGFAERAAASGKKR